MDLTLSPLANSDTTLLDFNELFTPSNAPARSLGIDRDSDLEVAVEASGNGGSGGGGSGNVVFIGMFDDDENEDGRTNPLTRDDDFLFVDDDVNDELHEPSSDSESSLNMDPSPCLELAVDAAGNGGGGGGGSGNVVCADMSDDENDGYGSTNTWTREDAIRGLTIKFWIHHPDREPGESIYTYLDISVGPDHPQYGLYMRVLDLVNRYFDELNSEGESNMISEIKRRVELAWNAYTSFGYRNSRAENLPDRAELMLTRFVVPYDAIDESIASMLEDMGCIRMLYVDGNEPRSYAVTIGH